jgi:glutathione-regulated potassium-efflux system ancillary protein KefC
MTEIWTLAALWLGLALLATLLSIWLRIATALSEIVVGTIAQLVIGAIIGAAVLRTDQSWVKFLSGTGAILLTFLAGAALDPVVFRERWKEAGAIGVVSFLVPFLGCAGAARYLLGWDPIASWLAGVAMSTTSIAVVYAVMLEFGFNATNCGKVVLAACFVTDLGTVLMLGLIFAPFTIKTLIFVGVCIAILIFLPWIAAQFFRLYGGRPSELETKYLLLLLFGLGGLAGWADSEAVLPGLFDWNDTSGQRRQRSHSNPKTADALFRISNAVLFHPCWFFCFGARPLRCSSRIPCDAFHKAHYQNSRRVSGCA